MPCIFCKIVSGALPSFKVYEDDRSLAFLDIHPIRPGHTLVIPKEHHKNFSETPEDLLQHLITVCKKAAAGAVKSTQADGFNLSVNNGAAAGQDVFHTHFHIIPRKDGDNLSSWPHMDYKDGEASKIAEDIRTKIL